MFKIITRKITILIRLLYKNQNHVNNNDKRFTETSVWIDNRSSSLLFRRIKNKYNKYKICKVYYFIYTSSSSIIIINFKIATTSKVLYILL